MFRSRSLIWIGVFGITILFAPAFTTSSQAASTASARQIDQVLLEIQRALLKVQTEAASRSLPILSSVSLELETEVAYGANGELDLYVVSIGGTTENQSVQRVSLKLVPPRPYSEAPIASAQISETLSSAILAVAQGVAKARNRPPPLTLSKLETEIRFVVKAAGEGGIKVALLPLTASLKGNISNSAIQIITVTFEAAGK